MATTAEKLNEAVYKHRILWSELRDRVVDAGVPHETATALVCDLIEKRSVSLPVAVALTELIIEAKP